MVRDRLQLRGVRQPADFSLPLTDEDARRLIGALTTHVETWRSHYDEDGGRTHAPEELAQVQMEFGELIWRLEVLAVVPGQAVEHSNYAVRPEDGEDDGGAGVREPRRPDGAPPALAAEADTNIE